MICVLLPFPSEGALEEREVVAYIARSQAQLVAQLEQRTRDYLSGSPETLKRQYYSEMPAGRLERVCGA